MRLSRQDIFAIVAMVLFALGMGVLWVLLKGFGVEFGMGVAVGGILGLAVATYATGSRGGAGR